MSSMSGKHTPFPWVAECVGTSSLGPDGVDVYEINNGYQRIAEHLSKEDAILIVRAALAHEAMREALKNLRADVQRWRTTGQPDLTAILGSCEQADAALKLAEES